MKKMLPIHKVKDVQMPESKKFMEEGWHSRLYLLSPNDYKEVAGIWKCDHFDGSGPLEVIDGPPQGGDMNDYEGISEAFVP